MDNEVIKKLEYLNETKGIIKNTLINKGINVSDDTPFRDYVDKIKQISQKLPTQTKTLTVEEAGKTVSITPDDGYALSEVAVTTNVPVGGITQCIQICGTSANIDDGVNYKVSGTKTLPENKKGYVVCIGTATGNLSFTVSPYTSVSTPVNQVDNYNGAIYIRNTLSIYTIDPSKSARTVSVTMTSSDAQAKHLFAFLIY